MLFELIADSVGKYDSFYTIGFTNELYIRTTAAGLVNNLSFVLYQQEPFALTEKR